MRSDEKRFSDWKSFVAYAKKQNAEGKKPTIANVARRGSMERVVLQLTLEPFGIDLQQVSFDKGSQRYASLKGGKVDVMLEQTGDVRGFIESCDFKALLTLRSEEHTTELQSPLRLSYAVFYMKKNN